MVFLSSITSHRIVQTQTHSWQEAIEQQRKPSTAMQKEREKGSAIRKSWRVMSSVANNIHVQLTTKTSHAVPYFKTNYHHAKPATVKRSNRPMYIHRKSNWRIPCSSCMVSAYHSIIWCLKMAITGCYILMPTKKKKNRIKLMRTKKREYAQMIASTCRTCKHSSWFTETQICWTFRSE